MSESTHLDPRPTAWPESLQPLRAQVDAALDRYTQFDQGCPTRLREAIRYMALAPGKRLRPILCLLATQACGGDPRTALPPAVSVELIHTYSLIHDDLPAMDDDDLRRGRPTCHVQYGEALAILAGDALIARAFEILATDLPPALAAQACAELARAAGAEFLVGGQVDDLAAEQEATGGIEQAEAIHLRKTAAMLQVSLRLGGVVAQATPAQLNLLGQFGRHLGLAFQIVDDLLDQQGDPARLGKRTGKDQQRGKLTYPELLGIAGSRRRAGELIGIACGYLTQLPGPVESLTEIARYILNRDQ